MPAIAAIMFAVQVNHLLVVRLIAAAQPLLTRLIQQALIHRLHLVRQASTGTALQIPVWAAPLPQPLLTRLIQQALIHRLLVQPVNSGMKLLIPAKLPASLIIRWLFTVYSLIESGTANSASPKDF